MKNTLQVIASLVAKNGHADKVRDLLTPAIKNFRAEPGCMGYVLMEDRKQVGRFVTFETWKDEAALNVTSRTIIRSLPKQLRVRFIPLLHRLHRSFAV